MILNAQTAPYRHYALQKCLRVDKIFVQVRGVIGMSNQLEYKGYYAKVEIDFEANEFYGEIDGISDFVNFISNISEGVPGIIMEFHSAVDDYLEFCQAVGKQPAHSEHVAEFA